MNHPGFFPRFFRYYLLRAVLVRHHWLPMESILTIMRWFHRKLLIVDRWENLLTKVFRLAIPSLEENQRRFFPFVIRLHLHNWSSGWRDASPIDVWISSDVSVVLSWEHSTAVPRSPENCSDVVRYILNRAFRRNLKKKYAVISSEFTLEHWFISKRRKWWNISSFRKSIFVVVWSIDSLVMCASSVDKDCMFFFFIDSQSMSIHWKRRERKSKHKGNVESLTVVFDVKKSNVRRHSRSLANERTSAGIFILTRHASETKSKMSEYGR